MSERVVIDKGWRIVIPKPLRTRLGLQEGDLLVVEERDDGLVVRQENKEGGLVRRGKRLFKPKDRNAGMIGPDRFLERQSQLTCVVAANGLVEAYSTLTRLPAGLRLTPFQASASIAN